MVAAGRSRSRSRTARAVGASGPSVCSSISSLPGQLATALAGRAACAHRRRPPGRPDRGSSWRKMPRAIAESGTYRGRVRQRPVQPRAGDQRDQPTMSGGCSWPRARRSPQRQMRSSPAPRSRPISCCRSTCRRTRTSSATRMRRSATCRQPDSPYGAAHESEVQYLFDLSNTPFPGGLSAPQQRLAASMKRFWTTFARRGRPSSFGGPAWPRFDAAGQRMLSLVPPRPQVETGFAAEHHCAFWTHG